MDPEQLGSNSKLLLPDIFYLFIFNKLLKCKTCPNSYVSLIFTDI